MGVERQQEYLDEFNRMNSSEQALLRAITRKAREDGDPYAKHVIMAMLGAAKHPVAFFKLVVAISKTYIALKGAEMNGDEAEVKRHREELDDFHLAAYSFSGMKGDLSGDTDRNLGKANADKLLNEEETSPERPLPISTNERAMERIRRYKEKAHPELEEAKRERDRRYQDGDKKASNG